MAHIRELPPLRLHLDVRAPAGRHYRWGEDEPRPENIPSGLRFSDTMPGGFESLDVTLARKPAVDFADLERLSTVRALGVGGEVAWEGRIERAPKVSGDQIAISPSAVGWQAHLDDDKSVKELYRDISFANWHSQTLNRRDAANATYKVTDPEVLPGSAVRTGFTSPWGSAAGNRPMSEAWYDAHGIPVDSIAWHWIRNPNTLSADTNWTWQVLMVTDELGGTGDSSGNLRGAGSSADSMVSTVGNRTWLVLQFFYAAVASASNAEFAISWDILNVIGDHGLTLQGSLFAVDSAGFYDADIIGHALGKYCPMIESSNATLTASDFIISHLVFFDPTTVSEVIRQVTRFGLRDWAVWDGPTFWLHDRGARGRKWRARVGPTQLEEAGPQVDRLWNSVIVAYQDVDGSTRTVGPVGSGADTEDDALFDSDPENPANVLGIVRREMLTMGVSTSAGAIEIGRRFLEESKVLNTSGSARIVGHVEDDRGVIHPYWRVRAGDTISFVDASDTSYRRIVRTEKNTSDSSCSIDLDSPPEGLQALLERLGVVLTPLGL